MGRNYQTRIFELKLTPSCLRVRVPVGLQRRQGSLQPRDLAGGP